MNGNFNNNQFPVFSSGCGAPQNVQGVAVFSPEATCPTNGYGASSFQTPASPLKFGLTPPTARIAIASSTAIRRIAFMEEQDAMCEAAIEAEAGGAIVYFCADGVATLNAAAEHLCCFVANGGMLVAGIVGKTSTALAELTATQILFDPCNPCIASATNFVCANGCNDNSNFILTNAVIGAYAGLVVEIPAGVAITFDICTCAPEVRSFATCPISVPSIAQIASSPACPPYGVPAQQGFAQSVQPFNGR